MQKKFIMLGMVVGSFAGSYIPLIWGILGGCIGVWADFKVDNWL
jgi:hypothetical protein